METLPYWPEVVEPSPALAMWVILGIPIVIGLGIAALAAGSKIARQARRGFGDQVGAWWLNPGSLTPVALDTDDDSAPYTIGDRRVLLDTARRAEDATGLHLSIYLGPAEGKSAEDFAIDLLDSLADPEQSLLVHFDPATGHAEFVTGDVVDERISVADLAEATAVVDGAVTKGNPVTGLVDAITLLARRASSSDVAVEAEQAPAELIG